MIENGTLHLSTGFTQGRSGTGLSRDITKSCARPKMLTKTSCFMPSGCGFTKVEGGGVLTRGWLTHGHLGYYLDEYTFRFNRRTSRSHGSHINEYHNIYSVLSDRNTLILG